MQFPYLPLLFSFHHIDNATSVFNWPIFRTMVGRAMITEIPKHDFSAEFCFAFGRVDYLRFWKNILKYPGFPATPLTGRSHLVPGFPGRPGSIPIHAAVQRPQSPSLSLINIALHGFPPNCKFQTTQNAHLPISCLAKYKYQLHVHSIYSLTPSSIRPIVSWRPIVSCETR